MGFSKLKTPKICEQCWKPFEAKTVVTCFCSPTRANKSGKERKRQTKEAEQKQALLEESAEKIAQMQTRPYISITEATIPFGISKAALKQAFIDAYLNLSAKIKGIQEQEEKQNIGLNYTRKSFILYLSDEHLDILCRNVLLYIANANMRELKPIKVKELTAIDLRHFGWNIWNFFKPRGQEEIASFLKTVFSDVFRETEVKSIKRHLKDDELKVIIKIEEVLL